MKYVFTAAFFGILLGAFYALNGQVRGHSYFPEGIWGETHGAWTKEQQAEFYEEWFGDHLSAMNEQPLWNGSETSSKKLFVRLLYLPSFNKGRMLMISNNNDGSMSYVFKILSGAGGYAPGHLQSEETRKVEGQIVVQIEGILSIINPFGANIRPQVFDPNRMCSDGTQIVLEFAQQDKYVALQRHECDLSTVDPIRGLVDAFDTASRGLITTDQTFEVLR